MRGKRNKWKRKQRNEEEDEEEEQEEEYGLVVRVGFNNWSIDDKGQLWWQGSQHLKIQRNDWENKGFGP